MTLSKFTVFVRQPSTVLGISTLIGALTALLTDQITWQAAIPALAGGLAAIALPDNGGARVAIKDAAVAVVAAEQAVVSPAAKDAVAVGAVRTTAMIALLITVGLGSSVWAAETTSPAHTDKAAFRLTGNLAASFVQTDSRARVTRAKYLAAKAAN